jgi:hypothetical protein
MPAAKGNSRQNAVAHGRQIRGELKIITAIFETVVIERILDVRGLPAPVLPTWQGREPG